MTKLLEDTMAILHVTSTNPNLSYIISKNPSSGMTAKTLRKGTLFGFYPNGKENEYVAYFADKLNDVSFSEKTESNFEYLDTTRYASAFLQTAIITELFRSAFRKQSEHDTAGYEHTLKLNIKLKRDDMIFKAFQGIENLEVTYQEIAKNHFEVIFKTNESLYFIFNSLGLFSLMAAITNGDEVFIDASMASKYAEILAMLDAPYQLRYLYQLKVLPNRKVFKSSQSVLETSQRYNSLKLHNGSTADCRFNFVKDRIDFDIPIIEIGCGEGFYTVPFAKKANQPYVAIDIDEEVLNITQNKLKKRNIEDVSFYANLTDYLSSGKPTAPVDAILMEVIEHMPIDQSKALIKEILTMDIHHLFISTPMKEFNKHYFGDNETMMRHADHSWEATKDEFIELITSCLEGTDYTFTYHLVGDVVDGEAPSQAVIIQPK